jgi:glycosyltransferase involved in cell wall biosynthesis
MRPRLELRPDLEPAAMPAVRRRLLFVNRYFHPDESATAQLLTDLTVRLVARGFDVRVVTSRQLYGSPATRLAARSTLRGVNVHRLWTTHFGRGSLPGRACDYASFYVSAFLFLLLRLRSGDIVIAKTDPPLISLFAAAAAKLRGAVLVNWLQDIFPEVATHVGANPLPARVDGCLRRLRDASLRAAAANVVLGGRMRDYVVGRGISPATVVVIENWADTALIAALPSAQSSLRQRLGLEARFVVQYSGNLGRAHEYVTLLEAATALRNDAGIVFLAVGGGFNMEALQREAAARGLPNFRFLGYQPRETLGDSLSAGDVHLVNLRPSLEGLIVPSKFYGILAAARPVIVTGDADGELARIVRATGCGLVVAGGDAGSLVDAIRELRADVARRARMGATARQLAVASYSAGQAVDRWVELLASSGTRAV